MVTHRSTARRAIAGVLALLVALPVVLALTPTRATAASPPRVLLIGDSTLAAVRWYRSSQRNLAGLDYVLDAQSCRAVTAVSCVGRTVTIADGRVSS